MNTNIITKHIIKTKRFVTALLLLFALSLNFSCIDNAEEFQVVTANPFGVGIIVFSSIPAQIFGNGCEVDTIKLNTGLIADGSTIEVEVTNTGGLEGEAGGCVTGAVATIMNSMATFEFLSPIFIGNEEKFIRNEEQIETVNVAVRITTPDGTTINDFFTALVNAVGITAPDDFDTTPNDTLAPTSLFFNLPFLTFGLIPGTEVMCEVSDESLGMVTESTVVLGNIESGSFNVEYVLTNGSIGGIQVLTCMVELCNPITFGPQCSPVPLSDRKIFAEVIITQGAADDIANPPPPPAPNSITCELNPITGGNDGTCTCNNTNAAGEEICFTSPGPELTIGGGGCAIADVNGNATIPFTTMIVDEQEIEQVTCSPTGSPFFAQTNITIDPLDFTCAINCPTTIIGGTGGFCTATRD
ncbi:MAG: hypothetical protein IID03_06305, partial [Candidatus Dadabacteria bacterium]|nr:hypothetical protein [Candidatus Dadabacteria bacterium]